MALTDSALKDIGLARELSDDDGDFLKEKVLLESERIPEADLRTVLLLTSPWTGGKVRYLYGTLDYIAQAEQPE